MSKIGRTSEIIKLENVHFIEDSLKGYNIVVTGALEHFSRKDIETTINQLGGKLQKSITNNTSFLLIGGEHIGSKYQKAKEMNIKIIDEQDFLKRIVEGYQSKETL